jgi:hypothetical protein
MDHGRSRPRIENDGEGAHGLHQEHVAFLVQGRDRWLMLLPNASISGPLLSPLWQ